MHELYFLNLSFISFNNVCERETEKEGDLENHFPPLPQELCDLRDVSRSICLVEIRNHTLLFML